MIRYRVIVKGVVQGVGFRFFVHGRACRMGLSGYVRNRPDGAVEVEVEGPENRVRDFLGELRIGPVSAHVAATEIDQLEGSGEYDGFEIRF